MACTWAAMDSRAFLVKVVGSESASLSQSSNGISEGR